MTIPKACLFLVLFSGAALLHAEDKAGAKDRPLPPAAQLRINPAESSAPTRTLLDPHATGWKDAAPTRILLNRTPRVYQTEPPFTGKIPALEVRAARAEGKLVLLLVWDDATRNAPAAPPRQKGESDKPEKPGKRPTRSTDAFADAAAVMVPRDWKGPGFPSLQMGDARQPVRIFYWNASRGAEELSASGRATPKQVASSLAHQAVHKDGQWRLTLLLPDQPEGTPIAFAVWDGASADRDGLKFFSIWYVLAAREGASHAGR